MAVGAAQGRRRAAAERVRFVVAVATAAVLATPAASHAQDAEPRLADLHEAVQQPWLTLGALLVTSFDAGLDDAPANASVRAARLRLGGTLDGGWSYFLQTNFASGTSLLDARIGYAASERFAVHAGRFKTPYSREFIAYLGDLDFIQRSRVVEALAPNRQIGVQLSGGLGDHVRWSYGVFTGGENAPRNESLMSVLRVEAAALSVGGGELSFAGQTATGRDAAITGRTFPVTFEGDGHVAGADLRYERGPLLLAGEYHRAEWDPIGAPDTDAEGWFVTAGWMVTPDNQVIARWDRWRAPGAQPSDYIVGGINLWPQSFAQLMLNWWVPLDDGEPQRFLAGLEMRL